MLYLLTREPLGEFSQGFVIRHFLALEVHFQLKVKICRNKKRKKKKSGKELMQSFAVIWLTGCKEYLAFML